MIFKNYHLYAYSYMVISIPNTNNLQVIICFQVFLSHINNFQVIIWF